MRVVGKTEARGSLRWIRESVNSYAPRFNEAVIAACGLRSGIAIEWVSPRASDDYAEYRDGSFLKKLELTLPNRQLSDFWPARGPQWDALGRTEDGNVLLVEAKANVPEIVSGASAASEGSRRRIDAALAETKEYLGVDPSIPWSGRLYQYANRLSHLYLLRHVNKVPAWLVFVYFVGDSDVRGPSTIAEWEAALTVAKGVLRIGERHRLSKYVCDVFVSIGDVGGAARQPVAADGHG
jgi:hypothetical protein